MKQNIFVGSDHGGVEAKSQLIGYLEEKYPNIKTRNLGVDTTESVDYPDIAKKVCKEVLQIKDSIGFLICGTGQGMNIASNKVNGIISTLIHNTDAAKMAAAHNNFNIACFGGRFGLFDNYREYIDILVNTEFEGQRHERRTNKLNSKYMNSI